MKEIHQVLSSMLAQEQRVSQIAHNLANVNTVGFKKETMAFEDYMKHLETAQAQSETGTAETSGLSWARGFRGYTDLSLGNLQETGRPLDVALTGEGFFGVQDANGDMFYTRAGNFGLDEAGRMVTVDGLAVLDDNGREIQMNRNGGPAQIANDGTIMQDGAEVARLGVTRFQDPQRLVRHGLGRWTAPADVQPEAVDAPSMRGGMLEGSNVNAIGEMTAMIETQRAYELNQKVMQSLDDAARKRIEAASS